MSFLPCAIVSAMNEQSRTVNSLSPSASPSVFGCSVGCGAVIVVIVVVVVVNSDDEVVVG